MLSISRPFIKEAFESHPFRHFQFVCLRRYFSHKTGITWWKEDDYILRVGFHKLAQVPEQKAPTVANCTFCFQPPSITTLLPLQTEWLHQHQPAYEGKSVGLCPALVCRPGSQWQIGDCWGGIPLSGLLFSNGTIQPIILQILLNELKMVKFVLWWTTEFLKMISKAAALA